MDHTTKIKPNQSVLALIPLDRPKKKIETIKEFTKRETKWERERERVLIYFGMNNLEGIEERGGNEVKRNLQENQFKTMIKTI